MVKGYMQPKIKKRTLEDFLFEFCTLNRVFLPSFHINAEIRYRLSCHVSLNLGPTFEVFKKKNISVMKTLPMKLFYTSVLLINVPKYQNCISWKFWRVL